ncbi:MAG: hypothetical protein ACJA01_002188 [Saprospiraceae bacterium]|jgi:hypothetical protein
MNPLQKVIISGNGPFGDISIILNSLMLRHHRGSKNKNIIQNLPFSDDPHFPEWTQGFIENIIPLKASYNNELHSFTSNQAEKSIIETSNSQSNIPIKSIEPSVASETGVHKSATETAQHSTQASTEYGFTFLDNDLISIWCSGAIGQSDCTDYSNPFQSKSE